MTTHDSSPFGPAMNPDHPVAEVATELAHALSSAGFTADGIAGHLGPEYTEALHRGEPAAVALGTSGDSDLDHLIRIFVLHEHVPATLLSDVLGARLAAKLLDSGVAETDEHGTVFAVSYTHLTLPTKA